MPVRRAVQQSLWENRATLLAVAYNCKNKRLAALGSDRDFGGGDDISSLARYFVFIGRDHTYFNRLAGIQMQVQNAAFMGTDTRTYREKKSF